MPIRTRGAALVAGIAAAAALVAGCGGTSTPSSPQGASYTPGLDSAPPQTSNGTAAATPSTADAPSTASSTSSTRLAPALLHLEDLPPGFRSEPLTARNLPSLIHGCAGLEVLQQGGIADQAQAEWTKGALDDYVDEAVIQPQGQTAAGLVEQASAALDQCGSVKVVEEGLSITLKAEPLPLAKIGTSSHAWHTSAKYGLGSMEMNVVLIQQDDLVVLIAQTRIDGKSNEDLTLQAAQAAARRAADFQKKS